MSARPRPPIVATIAATDSGGGAGIQADLKAFAACGAYGVSVVVALTAQNTRGVRALRALPLSFISEQFRALDEDLRPVAAKTGMLLSAHHIERVARELRRRSWAPLVVDPVMVAKSGDRLLAEDAIDVLRRRLLPLAAVVTPNWPEAAELAGLPVRTEEEALRAGRAIAGMGARVVVVKGGHSPGAPVDLVLEPTGVTRLLAERAPGRHTHGTGCTFSAAIAAFLGWGLDPLVAISRAKRYVTRAIQEAPGLGGGHGPLEHFPQDWPRDPRQPLPAGAGGDIEGLPDAGPGLHSGPDRG